MTRLKESLKRKSERDISYLKHDLEFGGWVTPAKIYLYPFHYITGAIGYNALLIMQTGYPSGLTL